MDDSHRKRITYLLNNAADGNREVMNELFSLVYEELKRVGHHYIKNERSGHTLNTTALVHETYLKLIGNQNIHWENRAHFFAAASQAMRRILVDYARKHLAEKRGGKAEKLPIENFSNIITEQTHEEIIVLDEALSRLESFDKRKSKIVEYRFFGGLTIEETAEVLNLGIFQIKQEWRLARAWLYRELKKDFI